MGYEVAIYRKITMQKNYMTDNKYLELSLPFSPWQMGTAAVERPFSAQNQSILVDSIEIKRDFINWK